MEQMAQIIDSIRTDLKKNVPFSANCINTIFITQCTCKA